MEDTQPKVLLLDDDKFLLDMYSVKFSQAGFSVVPCFSTAEALEKLRAGEKPQVMLFDITMPGDDGFVFLQTVKSEKLSDGSVMIALTNQSNDEDRKKAEELGVNKYVIKASMIPSEVVAMVQQEVGKK